MMSIYKLILFVFIFGFFSDASISKEISRNLCSEAELVAEVSDYKGNTQYNNLVCSSTDDFNKGNYMSALKSIESAEKINIFVYPNVLLYSKKALIYSRMGERDKALENLEKGELSIRVMIGNLKCKETQKGYILIGKFNQPYSGNYTDEIAKKMCSVEYESIYDKDNIESVLFDAKVVENYLKIKELINKK